MPRFIALPAAFLLLCAACESSTEPATDTDTALTVDASAGWAYVRLGDPAVPVTVTDPATSTDWDLAFNATSVMLNGGAAGPGGVSGYCLCQNSAATSRELLAMTPASELGAFAAVGASDIPAGTWATDVLDPAIDGWYAYNPVTHVVSVDTAQAFKVRLSSAQAPGYAAFRVKSMVGASQANAGTVTIDYIVQSGAGTTPSAVRTAVLDASAGRVYFDFETGASSAASWDISLEGYTFRVNSGVSGTAGVGAVAAGEPFHLITDAGDVPAQVYKGDAYGGVFAASPWYRYNLTGQHDVTPTFDVYLVRRGTAVYKVQITGYYSVTGVARHISIRSERIDA